MTQASSNPMRRIVPLATVAWLFACTQTTKPTDPIWGKQPCASCRMLVSQPRFAAQGVTDAGDRLYFDDVGCMVAYEHDQHLKLARRWVRNGEGHWIDPVTTKYRTDARTPMDFGFEVSPTGSADYSRVEADVTRRVESGR